LQVIHYAKVLFPSIIDQSKYNSPFQRTEHLGTVGFNDFLQSSSDLDRPRTIGERNSNVFDAVPLILENLFENRKRPLTDPFSFLPVMVDDTSEQIIRQASDASLSECCCIDLRIYRKNPDHF